MSQPRLLLLARSAGLLGGLAWSVRWPLGSGAAGDAAYWIGLVALAVALAAYGATLVRVTWLQVVVGVALPVLVGSLLEVLRGDGDGLALDGLVGLGALLVAAAGAARARRGRPSRRTGTRSHAR
ncbi:hypothetical protein QWY28_16505 [Nocardioides sp. SOB77]|uniref:Integral membrane protein n=1 Tax=Nocardioides oceani TaxID=3058369 RepID=A0ABT8FJ57_9ACTN|nr:hypothetical protein [Nocardioides oceani]MDN4174564.1 hypothetical protein [Nocardioides oceani]